MDFKNGAGIVLPRYETEIVVLWKSTLDVPRYDVDRQRKGWVMMISSGSSVSSSKSL